MTTFPGSPRVVKGAIVGIDAFNPVASVIVFQYNPEKLSRSLDAQTVGGGEGRSEALRNVQLTMLAEQNRQHPYYWASFIPIGARGPIDFGPKQAATTERE